MTGQTQQAVSSSTPDLLDSICSAKERSSEKKEKQARLAALMDELGLDAVFLRRNENIAWATSGQVETLVAIPAETGVASLLLTRNGQKYYLTTNNEAARLADEEFSGLDYEPVIAPWYDNNSFDIARKLIGTDKIGVDLPLNGYSEADLAPLRSPLTSAEIARFRWLARNTAELTAQTILDLEPGMTEEEMSALVAQRLLSRSILPSVLLMAVDDRIRKYKHAVTRGGVLERFGMLNLCARKWGLAVSITRFVHFGKPPQEMVDGFGACAEINARLLHASRNGATSAQLYAIAERAYRDAGFPGEEKLHHQGGPAGYLEREWVAAPNGTQKIADPQALAWNPSIRGAKVEDTALLANGTIEILTQTSTLPRIDAKVDGVSYPAADLLVR
jgi:Xaa-Pro dipeptidase